MSERWSDAVVLTSDNPRSEDPLAIIGQIRSGMGGGGSLVVEPDRVVAIRTAVEMAAPGDVVVIAGKGHETTQVLAHGAVPFDDRAEARRALLIGPPAPSLECPDRDLVDDLRRRRPVGGGPVDPVSHPMAGQEQHRPADQGGRPQGPYRQGRHPHHGWDRHRGCGRRRLSRGPRRPGVTFSRSGALVILALVGAGLIGFADDWIKVRHRRSLGLYKRAKFGAQIGLGVLFSLLAVYWAHASTTLSFTRYDSIGLHMGTGLWVVWATVVIAASANAVNLTDGLDGLAAGASTFCFACLAIIGYWQYRHLGIYHVPDALDLALAAVALAGACLGFLWWNAAPAKIFMGDTGSLSIGSALAALCLLMNLDLLLVVIGGLFVIVTLSVVIQIVSFRVFHRRVFLMAPLHHHFELMGWPETTVIVRFWILAGLFAALGLGIFYGDFLSVGR